jgi:hypothetical protein
MPTIGVALPIGDKAQDRAKRGNIAKAFAFVCLNKLRLVKVVSVGGAKCVLQVFVPDGPCQSRRK